MTELIHFTDCYASEFDAHVIDKLGPAVVLDRTAFYPKGGGQPDDTGMIGWEGGEVPVVKVRKEGGRVLHYVKGPAPLVGQGVHGVINWERRYAHMKYHTAQHLLSAHFLERYGALTTGNQIRPSRGRIDFDLENLSPKIVKSAENRINGWVEEGLPVRILMVPRGEAIDTLDPERTRIDRLPESVKVLRIVEIGGIDKVACAGTHVHNTSELGSFRVTKTSSKGTGRKRIEFMLD